MVLAQVSAESLFPGREASLPTAQVFDTFLGYFAGLVVSDSLGYADSAYLDRLMPEFDAFLSLSFEEIRRVSRSRQVAKTFVAVVFREPIDLPIPFKILWDTPGTIYAAHAVVAEETRIEAFRCSGPPGATVVLSPLFIYDFVEGEIRIDFDPWLDSLMGHAVDDVTIRRALLFRLEGRWYAALMGVGYRGQLVIGYFDLGANRILVPLPRRLRAIGPVLGKDIVAEAGLWDAE